MELTQEIVRELLDYDADTGVLTWKERDVKWFSSGKRTVDHVANQWNAKFAGKQAFTSNNGTGYRIGAIKNKLYLAHRIIWLWAFGDMPNFVDHKNGVRNDNRLSNLREVTTSQNQMNKALSTRNTTGYCGVTFDKRDGKYYGRITCNGVNFSFKGMTTAEAAFQSMQDKRRQLGFSDRHGFL